MALQESHEGEVSPPLQTCLISRKAANQPAFSASPSAGESPPRNAPRLPGGTSSLFRPVEHWKSALMTLPDNGFFDLMRGALGNIKTPFNKQKLLEDFGAFLSREDIRAAIGAYLDEGDHRIIAAVALLKEPSRPKLETFFAGEIGGGDLHTQLINLEERFILYRFELEGVRRLALNPLLEPVLSPLVLGTEVLFPSSPQDPAERSFPPPDKSAALPEDRLFAALAASLSEEPEIFRAEGGIRKKVLENGKKFFPFLDLEMALGALQGLGIFRQGIEGFDWNDSRLWAFCGLPREERLEFWAAGLYLAQFGKPESLFQAAGTSENEEKLSTAPITPFSRGKIRASAGFIHHFLEFLKPGRYYPWITLRRFMEFLNRENSGALGWGGPVLWESEAQFEGLVKILGSAGLLREDPRGRGFMKASPVSPPGKPEDAPAFSAATENAATENTGVEGAEAENAGTEERPVIAMDTAFSFVLYPEISFVDAMALAGFCSVTGTGGPGQMVRFELCRSSAVRGFDRGLDSAFMINLLRRLSGNRLERTLEWTLKDWETRHAAVTIDQGIVLTLADEQRYLAETPPVASLIRRVLSPGVYMLSAGDRAEAAAALRKAGVDIIAQPPLLTLKETDAVFNGRRGWAIPQGIIPESAGEKSPPNAGTEESPAQAQALKERLKGHLDTLKLSKQEKDELVSRIDRRLILSETQLDGASLKFEKLEARGLDYVGKFNLAKQVLSTGGLLEISWRSEGEEKKVLGVPQGLEKQGGESILVLKPLASPAVEEPLLRVPLGKISLLKRIKQSIFGE